MTRVRVGIAQRESQDAIEAIGDRYLYKQVITLVGDTENSRIGLTMKLGGYTWEDGKQGKETLADGGIAGSISSGIFSMEKPDMALPNVKVTLYEVDPSTNKSKKAVLITTIGNEIIHDINPTITDENGYYQFNGLDISKKYYVKFEYNGQIYLPTDYLATGNNIESMYNTESWYKTSKALEEQSLRDNFDAQFQEIGAYPTNYKSSNALGAGEMNVAFNMLELMGYTLNKSGQYVQDKMQLVDGFAFDSRGLQTENYVEGTISKRIKEYISSNKKYPDEEALKLLYKDIAGGDKEILQKLQFIWDCNIYAYTSHGQGTSSEYDLYPPFDNFVVHQIKETKGNDPNLTYKQVYDGWVATNNINMVLRGGSSGEYKSIYDGQFYINLGLWRRQEFDMALKKDIFKAALKINGKTMVYDYTQREMNANDGVNSPSGQDNNTAWDINVRVEDGYYDNPVTYNRELYEADYNFDSEALAHPGSDLEVYITYMITVRNQSQSIEGKITEVVDYYDEDYTLKPNLSWIVFGYGGVDDNAYYEMMAQDQEIIDDSSNSLIGALGSSAETSDQSIYQSTGSISGCKATYVAGLKDHSLQSGESACIYLTFQVNRGEGDKGNRLKIKETKDNIAEINGFKTFYRDGTTLPNEVTKGSGDIAGLVDRDSNPGNVDDDLAGKNLEAGQYEYYFEDDTDRAPGLNLIINNIPRQTNGIVWEDDRTEKIDGAIIGNGIKDENEIGIAGVTVELVEKREDEGKQSEYIWQQVKSGSDGSYKFEKYIPGDYIIRFKYGDTDETALIDGGSNQTSYNGQDFKSTLYQIQLSDGQTSGLAQNDKTDTDGRYKGYVDTALQNERAKYSPEKGQARDDTFGYDIAEADKDENYSDAKDLWTIGDEQIDVYVISGNSTSFALNSGYSLQGRETVNEYSSGELTNYRAEVLASPYTKSKDLYEEFKAKTWMTAETGVMVVEVEYNRQQTGFTEAKDENVATGDNKVNGKYTLANVNFGLTERPKAQLEIDKSIENINLTLANQTVLFDIEGRANNALWQDHKEYEVEKALIDGDGMYENFYGTNHRYAYRTINAGRNESIDSILDNNDKGLVQLTMDEELMHGATIKIKYKIKITNVGEVDYVDNGNNKNFYYRADRNGSSIVTTEANQLIDYVHNNLQFDASDNNNKDWSIIEKEAIKNGSGGANAWLVRQSLWSTFDDFNTIIESSKTNGGAVTKLEPYNGDNTDKSVEERTLVLSQLITSENTDDDLTYDNMVEIVKTTNTASRRMVYSIVGNQHPNEKPSELDTSAAERVVILPPFGQKQIYYIVGGIVGTILVVGIALIIRKVLKKKNGKGSNGEIDR